jgi:intein/homing endonuclease
MDLQGSEQKIAFLEFNNHFQNQIIYHAIFIDEFLSKIRMVVSPSIFKTKEKRLFIEWIYEYYDEFKKAPQENFFDIFDFRKDSLSEDVYNRCVDLINLLSDITGSNWEYVLQRIKDAIMHYQMEEAIVECATRVKTGEYDLVKGIILKALKEPENFNPAYYDFFQDFTWMHTRSQGNIYRMISNIPELDKMIGGFKSKWLITLLGATKGGKCIKYDSPIVMHNGEILTIEEVYNQKRRDIFTLEESIGKIIPRNVIKHFNNGVKPCYRVTTRAGRTVETTLNHPFLTINGWKELSHLKIGNFIGVPMSLPVEGKDSWEIHKIKLLAYLIAEGGLTKVGQTSFTNVDKEIVTDFKQCVLKMGDKISPCKHDPISYLITNNGKKSNIRKWLSELGLNRKKSKDKFIPKEVFTLNNKCLKEFLSVLFTCDGSIFKSKGKNVQGISYSSTSKFLIDGVSHLLLRFGIVHRKRTKEEGYSYEIEIKSTEEVNKFIQRIGFKFSKERKSNNQSQTNKQGYIKSFPPEYSIRVDNELHHFIKTYGERSRTWWSLPCLKSLRSSLKRGSCLQRNTVNTIGELIQSEQLIKDANSDILWDKIVSIEYIGEHQTYDLTIPGSHNFISSDIIVHNTWWLIEIAIQAVFQGLNVLFVSLEMGKEIIDERFDMAISFATSNTSPKTEIMRQINGNWVCTEENVPNIYDLDYIANERRKFKKISGGNLKVMAFDRGRLNYRDIEVILDELEQREGWICDVLIVDYLGIMKETTPGQNKKERISENCLGLKEMCSKRNIVSFSAMQGNRKAMTAEIFHSYLVADDIDTIFNSDLVLALCQTKLEESQNKCRMYIANFRHGKQHGTIGMIRDLSIGQVCVGTYEIKEIKNEEGEAGEDF